MPAVESGAITDATRRSSDDSPEVRALRACLTGASADPEARRREVRAALARDPGMARIGALALRRTRDPEVLALLDFPWPTGLDGSVVQMLLEIATADARHDARCVAIHALADNVQQPRVRDELWILASTPTEPVGVRRWALRCLHSVQQFQVRCGGSAVPIHAGRLWELVRSQAPTELREQATLQLLGVTARADLLALLDLARSDREIRVRRAAIGALPHNWRSAPEDAWILEALDRLDATAEPEGERPRRE